jgi:hypothetical protein
VAAQTDVLAATTDGSHILGASTTGSNITLSDIGVTIPTAESPAGILTPISCPLATNSSTGVETLSPLVLTTSLSTPPAITANAAAVNQVVPSPTSSLAFITYTPPTTGATTGASLPYYLPGTGTVGYVPFKGNSAANITAPLAGAFTPDDKLFFVSTAGDNMIHYISVPLVTSNPANADTQQISPNIVRGATISKQKGRPRAGLFAFPATITPRPILSVLG